MYTFVYTYISREKVSFVTRTEAISVRAIRMLHQLAGLGRVERAIITFDVLFLIFEKVSEVNEVGNYQKVASYHIEASIADC